jgi:RNA polymerase sigma-70 factor, ECF subfamily
MSSRLTDPTALPVPVTDLDGGRDRLAEEVVVLFDRFRDPMLRYLSSFGLSFPDGEEVVQEAFLSLFQHLHHGKSRANLPGWLFRVAHNQALKRRCRVHRDLEAMTDAGSEDLVIDPSPSPEDLVASTQTHQRMLAMVQALPEPDRRCLSLRAEGLRYREIAAILDMSLGAVSISLARSLARIARSAER